MSHNCPRCGNPNTGYKLICPACKQVELLEKQNDLIERGNNPGGSGIAVFIVPLVLLIVVIVIWLIKTEDYVGDINRLIGAARAFIKFFWELIF
jgi:hypothetical protein